MSKEITIKNERKPVFRLILLVWLSVVLCCNSGCQDHSPSLKLDNSSTVKIDSVFPNTPTGNLVREHLRISMGHGEDAEAKYQQSLTNLRGESEAASVLSAAFKKVPPEYYFYRTMIVEALKQLRSDGALEYLNEIANEKIPSDRSPENAEINTRQDEIVIRITAVEGITLLAADSLAKAETFLIQLINHGDLTVRQMAARGYLQSPFGNIEDKMQELRKKLPEEELWYITTEITDIKKVLHPNMPEKFDIKTKNTSNSPKINEK